MNTRSGASGNSEPPCLATRMDSAERGLEKLKLRLCLSNRLRDSRRILLVAQRIDRNVDVFAVGQSNGIGPFADRTISVAYRPHPDLDLAPEASLMHSLPKRLVQLVQLATKVLSAGHRDRVEMGAASRRVRRWDADDRCTVGIGHDDCRRLAVRDSRIAGNANLDRSFDEDVGHLVSGSTETLIVLFHYTRRLLRTEMKTKPPWPVVNGAQALTHGTSRLAKRNCGRSVARLKR